MFGRKAPRRTEKVPVLFCAHLQWYAATSNHSSPNSSKSLHTMRCLGRSMSDGNTFVLGKSWSTLSMISVESWRKLPSGSFTSKLDSQHVHGQLWRAICVWTMRSWDLSSVLFVRTTTHRSNDPRWEQGRNSKHNDAVLCHTLVFGGEDELGNVIGALHELKRSKRTTKSKKSTSKKSNNSNPPSSNASPRSPEQKGESTKGETLQYDPHALGTEC